MYIALIPSGMLQVAEYVSQTVEYSIGMRAKIGLSYANEEPTAEVEPAEAALIMNEPFE